MKLEIKKLEIEYRVHDDVYEGGLKTMSPLYKGRHRGVDRVTVWGCIINFDWSFLLSNLLYLDYTPDTIYYTLPIILIG